MKKIIFFAAMMIAVSVSAQVDIANSLVVYYPFNGNSNDESGNSGHIVAPFSSLTTGDLTQDRFNVASSAISLVAPVGAPEFSTTIVHDMDSNFTINFWILNTQGNDQAFPLSFGQSVSSTDDNNYYILYSLYAPGSPNGIWTSFQIGSSSISCNQPSNIYSTNTQSTANWEMVTITRSQNTLTLYIDTVLISTSTILPSCISSTGQADLDLGNSQNTSAKLDDIMIHNRVLNSDEIAYLYNLTSSWSSSPTSTFMTSESAINIYPNPISEIVNIQFETAGTYLVEVMDMTGKIVYAQQTAEQNLQIKTADLTAGIYVINISNENGVV